MRTELRCYASHGYSVERSKETDKPCQCKIRSPIQEGVPTSLHCGVIEQHAQHLLHEPRCRRGDFPPSKTID